jgi:bifunctional NMN adenylyltransferase/nudix hydrolase
MSADVGIIVGRFQVPYLHEGHKNTIQTVLDNHKQIAIFLGVGHTRGLPKNPYDYNTRRNMMQSTFPEVGLSIHSIGDKRSDKEWSIELDKRISEIFPGRSIVLYGSRDSFISRYHGVHETLELETDVFVSGTEIREEHKNSLLAEEAFRIGINYSVNDRYFNPIPTVDIAVIKRQEEKVLLARKDGETKYRFIGGFVDTTDESLERAAIRELKEEAGNDIEVSQDIKYVTSRLVDDWRYSGEAVKPLTTLYAVEYMWGTPRPSDDIVELKWFDLNSLSSDDLMDEHFILAERLKEKLHDIDLYKIKQYEPTLDFEDEDFTPKKSIAERYGKKEPTWKEKLDLKNNSKEIVKENLKDILKIAGTYKKAAQISGLTRDQILYRARKLKVGGKKGRPSSKKDSTNGRLSNSQLNWNIKLSTKLNNHSEMASNLRELSDKADGKIAKMAKISGMSYGQINYRLNKYVYNNFI